MSELRLAEVFEPHSTEEAAAIIRRAAEQGTPVRLSARNMRAVTDYEPADLVISLQAGASLAQIAAATQPNNQFLALDPPVPAETSIGSVVARGAAGPLRLAHGTPRDQVLGLEIVAGDGRILEFGGKVVKNVAGYDLVRLLVGSHGTLGFITRVNMRLKPIPAVDRTASMATESIDAAIEIADAVRASHLDVVALEIISPPLTNRWTVLARLHGNHESVADAEQRLRDVAGAVPLEVTEGAAVWSRLAGAEHAAQVSIRLANLPSRLRETVAIGEGLENLLANPALAIHAGDGIVRLLGSSLVREGAAALREARESIEQHNGSLIVERTQPGAEVAAFGTPDGLALMQQIKRVFDPAGILGAGRMPL